MQILAATKLLDWHRGRTDIRLNELVKIANHHIRLLVPPQPSDRVSITLKDRTPQVLHRPRPHRPAPGKGGRRGPLWLPPSPPGLDRQGPPGGLPPHQAHAGAAGCKKRTGAGGHAGLPDTGEHPGGARGTKPGGAHGPGGKAPVLPRGPATGLKLSNLSAALFSPPSDVIPITAKKAGLTLVLEPFPEDSGILQRLFQESSSFQSLCEDYRDCLAALRNWQTVASGEALAMRGAYKDLQLELEQQVRQYLEDEKTSRIG